MAKYELQYVLNLADNVEDAEGLVKSLGLKSQAIDAPNLEDAVKQAGEYLFQATWEHIQYDITRSTITGPTGNTEEFYTLIAKLNINFKKKPEIKKVVA